MISKREVRHIAKLARLGLTSSEIKKFQVELSSILDYIGKLKKIDAELLGLSPASHPFESENITRTDEVSLKFKVKSLKLMELAPRTKNDHLKVKSILNPVINPSQKKFR